MDILCTIIHYNTPDLLEDAVRSFNRFYPNYQLVVVDNGSHKEHVLTVEKLLAREPETTLIRLDKNVYHGPAMDHVMKHVGSSEFVFFVDSDTVTKDGGFLENMIDHLSKDDALYGMGEMVSVNKRGFKSDAANSTPILLTPYMLLRRSIYLNLSPFVHHGQPTLYNFTEAYKKGYKLRHYPVSEYIDHRWRGTADRFGYGLGWRSKIDFILNKFGW